MGFAPGVPHFANFPFADLHFTGFAGAFGAHLMNFPFASRQGAANAGVATIVNAAVAKSRLRIMTCSMPVSRPAEATPIARRINPVC